MGEAKRRGSRKERVEQAIERLKQDEPINVPCQSCKLPLNGFTFIKSYPEGGVWEKKCPKCKAITIALVQSDHSRLDRTFSKSIDVLKDQGISNVSVSFIEKGIDTIEHGIIRL